MMTDLLLVEDNQDCRTTVAAILRLQGFEVTEAEDGPEALFLAKTLAPTLIICDVSLPTMSGFDVKRELNKEKELSSIPFVFMTIITTTLLFVLDLDPKKGRFKYSVEYPEQQKKPIPTI